MVYFERTVASSPKLRKMQEFIKQDPNVPDDDRERVPDRYVANSPGMFTLQDHSDAKKEEGGK